MSKYETDSEKLKEYKYHLDLKSNSTAAKTLKLVGFDKNVLELGCSVGTQSKILTENMNCKVAGIELNPIAAEKAKKYCSEILIRNLDQIDLKKEFPDQLFDVVLCADVLEHIYNPTELLRKIKPIISKDGYIVLSIPNIVHSALIFEMLHGKFDYREKGLLDDTHIRFFTRKTLIKTLNKAGFIIDQLDRGLAGPVETEFAVSMNKKEKLIFEYLKDNNDECFTYHFIVKAYPSYATNEEIQQYNYKFEHTNKRRIDNEQINLNNHDKEMQIQQLNKQVAILSSQLKWLESKFPYRAYKKFKSFIKK